MGVSISGLPSASMVQPTDQLELNQGGSSRSATIAQVAALFQFVPHTHPIAGVVGLLDALDGKAPTSHTHGIAEVAGLQGALDAKAATVPGYEWFNTVQELLAVILRGGITPSNLNSEQVRKSLDRLFGGGLASLSANTTLTVDDAGLVLVNASAAARTITLPAANALGGRPIRFQIKKSDNSSNTVTIQRAGTDTIEGGTSVVLSVQWRSVDLISDGISVWLILVSTGDQVPTGAIYYVPSNVAPPGSVKANGALLSRTTYAALWAFAQSSGNILSDATWLSSFSTGSFSTGDGSTTFRIPDLRGEFVRGWADGRSGVDSGRTIGSYQADALQDHTHQVLDRINGGAGIEPNVNGSNAGGSDITRTTTDPVTGRTASETRPRNIALLACIKF